MSAETPKKAAGLRLQHVVAHTKADVGIPDDFDEILVFGQELDALRHLLGKTGWVYAAIGHGQSFVDALKVDQA